MKRILFALLIPLMVLATAVAWGCEAKDGIRTMEVKPCDICDARSSEPGEYVVLPKEELPPDGCQEAPNHGFMLPYGWETKFYVCKTNQNN